MKKFCFFIAPIALIIFFTSCATTRSTSTTGNDDDSKTRTTTGEVSRATDKVTTTSDNNGNSIIYTQIYKGSKVQSWNLVVINPKGQVIYKDSGKRERYQDAINKYYRNYGYYDGGSYYSTSPGILTNYGGLGRR